MAGLPVRHPNLRLFFSPLIVHLFPIPPGYLGDMTLHAYGAVDTGYMEHGDPARWAEWPVVEALREALS